MKGRVYFFGFGITYFIPQGKQKGPGVGPFKWWVLVVSCMFSSGSQGPAWYPGRGA